MIHKSYQVLETQVTGNRRMGWRYSWIVRGTLLLRGDWTNWKHQKGPGNDGAGGGLGLE
jgi:hypothetical protein